MTALDHRIGLIAVLRGEDRVARVVPPTATNSKPGSIRLRIDTDACNRCGKMICAGRKMRYSGFEVPTISKVRLSPFSFSVVLAQVLATSTRYRMLSGSYPTVCRINAILKPMMRSGHPTCRGAWRGIGSYGLFGSTNERNKTDPRARETAPAPRSWRARRQLDILMPGRYALPHAHDYSTRRSTPEICQTLRP